MVRAETAAGLDHLGIRVDPGRNAAPSGDARVISPDGAAVTVMVVPTDEGVAARPSPSSAERGARRRLGGGDRAGGKPCWQTPAPWPRPAPSNPPTSAPWPQGCASPKGRSPWRTGRCCWSRSPGDAQPGRPGRHGLGGGRVRRRPQRRRHRARRRGVRVQQRRLLRLAGAPRAAVPRFPATGELERRLPPAGRPGHGRGDDPAHRERRRPLRAPNDLVLGADGGIWFTDHGVRQEAHLDRTGFHWCADGSDAREVTSPLDAPTASACPRRRPHLRRRDPHRAPARVGRDRSGPGRHPGPGGRPRWPPAGRSGRGHAVRLVGRRRRGLGVRRHARDQPGHHQTCPGAEVEYRPCPTR